MSVLENHDGHLRKKLRIKKDSAVLAMERGDGSLFVLRIYAREIPAYRMLESHSCENLPAVYRCETRKGLFLVEEEYIDGICLQDMLDGGARLDENQAADAVRKVCRALNVLHEVGFVHRDVKPEHVILTPEHRIVLIDLDASMRISPEKDTDTRLLGTAIYAAPEQFGLTRSDVRTDVYSVGILLNELLTGVHPAVTRYRGGRMDGVIERCIQMNPQDRYQNMDELTTALSSAHTSGRTSQNPHRRWFLPVAACVVCLGILIGAAALPDGKAEIQNLPQTDGTVDSVSVQADHEAGSEDEASADHEESTAGEASAEDGADHEASAASSAQASTSSESVTSDKTSVQGNTVASTKKTEAKSPDTDEKKFDPAALSRTKRIRLKWRASEIEDGSGFGKHQFDDRVEVLLDGKKTSDYLVYLEDSSCGTAVKESDGRLHLVAAKEGEWTMYVVCGKEYAAFRWKTTAAEPADETDNLTLHWSGYIVGPGGCFGATFFDDDITVCFNGQPISDYTVELGDPDQGTAKINADGTLHLRWLKKD
ncbi:MAG: serine/threonine protein kinase, partial [Anaerovoracaceae bacterium]